MVIVLVLSLLLAGLACVGSSRAQIKKADVNFEYMATVEMKKGDTLWDLAQKYYKDPFRWKVIMDMNKLPDERRIPIGTVVYIPVEDAKNIVAEVDKEITKKKVDVKETSAELKDLQDQIAALKEKLRKAEAENERLAKALKECQARNKKLTNQLKERDAIIKEQEAMIMAKDATNKELQAMLAELKVTISKIREDAEAASKEYKMHSEAQAKKDMQIEELEAKIRSQRREIEELEDVRNRLKARIEEAERRPQVGEREPRAEQPPAKPMKKADSRAMAAAMAIALVGSVLWIFSK
jgi:predicted RNase H-like nuclease (RuvC/YqgF family)